jgi:Na+-translocating ferredoxin:NAD+ oxidoreductase RnfC subunit
MSSSREKEALPGNCRARAFFEKRREKPMEKTAFLEAVRAAGIVGEGGAGFPAHVKYAAAADTVIANGCECEPLLHTDRHIMLRHAPGIFRALKALSAAAGARRSVLAVKAKHADVILRLRPAAEAGGIEIFPLEDFYPAGDEQILVREVTGRSVPPLGIPLNVGVVVANVGTLADVDAALGDGLVPPSPVTDKVLTVTGEVGAPAVMRAPLGTPLSACLAAAGGALPQRPVFIVGGPMMGRLVADPDGLARESVTKTTGGLIVLPAGHHLHTNASLPTDVMRRRAACACIQCRACSDLCPRRLIGHPFETHRIMRAFAARAERSALGAAAVMCCECGACEHYACPIGMSPRRINQAVKAVLREESLTYGGSRELLEENVRWREYRRIPASRLASRLGIAAYMHLETPYVGEIAPRAVTLPLRQHIGAASVAVVAAGDTVRKGERVGEIPEGALGARLHASIDGVVTAVDAQRITIEARGVRHA